LGHPFGYHAAAHSPTHPTPHATTGEERGTGGKAMFLAVKPGKSIAEQG